jgi:Rrf2 family iron-sulfur cluster assembly transcriptional regulator
VTYSKSTRYALYAALEMARSSDPVAVGAVAAKYGIPQGVLAKVLQQLVRAGIARGVRGVGGGYLLAKPASDITVLDVIAVHDPIRPEGHCLLQDASDRECEDPPACRIRRLFDEVSELVSCTFASVSLETLAGP